MDIYDLSNFNHNMEQTEHIIEINNQGVIKRNNMIISTYDSNYLRLLDEDVGIKTIKTIFHNNSRLETVDFILNGERRTYYIKNNEIIFNANPFTTRIYIKDLYDTVNGLYIHIYKHNLRYDISIIKNSLRSRSSLMSLTYDFSNIIIIKKYTNHYYVTTHLIDVYNYNDNIELSIKDIYLRDIVNKNENAIIYMKIFKIGNKSVRIYIEKIKVLTKNEPVIIHLCKFKDNKFIQPLDITNYDIDNNIEITNFPLGMGIDIYNSEIETQGTIQKCFIHT
jgi:hypothetical protein